ncbi:tRNA (guanine-N7)-methyltransferase [Bifidobacterium aemilianum]|uniref:tRNA (guanine-N(7)-)-methyltransferase n=1 Tax=Bifidobacterium aemilianum TaxID=2493120 RepID=A0A366K6L7_9BIFI|nr:tRNA (guanine-N7)-methyltransferase [Bifidobacterium aemilianum]RBP97386.1 tRNA (guanine-N7)-methyltransferase [Bifidobacterium aemilianum]
MNASEIDPTARQESDQGQVAQSATKEGQAAASPKAQGRPLLSFVRRSSHLTDRLQRAWDSYADTYLLDVNAGEGSLEVDPQLSFDQDFQALHWGHAHPLVLEIGTGQGENIVAAAQGDQSTDFLAVEVYDPGLAHTMLMAGKANVDNLRMAQVNAPELLEAISDGLLAEVWTFFPDPWPKTKHHKRRLVQEGLARQVWRTLKPGGVWRIATDIEDYALHVHEVMDGLDYFHNEGGLTVSLPTEHVGKGNADMAVDLPHADVEESTRFEGRVLTNFEKKGVAAGRSIHDFCYRKL